MENGLENIVQRLRELLPLLIQKYQVKSLEIFGSYVRAEQKVGSDLDLLVTFNKVPSLLKFLEMKNYLSDHLQINVDLVMKDALKPRIGQNILNESITL